MRAGSAGSRSRRSGKEISREGREVATPCILSTRWARWVGGACAACSPSARRVGGVAEPSDDDDSGMLDELVYEPCWKATWTYWTSMGGRSGGAVSLLAPEIDSIEEDEAAAGEEEHAAAGGLPILPRMADGKQRPSTTKAYLEVSKGKVQ